MVLFCALLALAGALGYTAASFLIKVALQRGAGPAQANLYSNLALALVVQPLWIFDRPAIPDAPIFEPLGCCVIFFLGQIFTFLALKHGDVSLVTPLLGTKVVFVTILNALVFHLPLTWQTWVAACVTTISVGLIGGGDRILSWRGFGSIAAFYAVISAAFFSLTDIFVQHWAGALDSVAFLPAMFGGVGLISWIYYLLADRKAFTLPPAAIFPLLGGGLLLGVQAGAMFFALSLSQDATGANVIYASRSIWSIVLAWSGGHLIGLEDRRSGAAVLLRRLIGALLLFGAILLILPRHAG